MEGEQEAAIAAAIAMIRAAGRGDLLAEEPAGPSTRGARPARLASAGVAAAVMSCTSSPSRPTSKAKKGRGGAKGKGPLSKDYGELERRGREKTDRDRQREEEEEDEMGDGQGLEEGELESDSEEEEAEVTPKRSRMDRREGSNDRRRYVNEEGIAEFEENEGDERRARWMGEQTGWQGAGQGASLEKRARSDANIITLQPEPRRDEGSESGPRTRAGVSRSGPGGGSSDREAASQAVMAGEQNEGLQSVWRDLISESQKQLEGYLGKQLANNRKEMLQLHMGREKHWREWAEKQEQLGERRMTENRMLEGVSATLIRLAGADNIISPRSADAAAGQSTRQDKVLAPGGERAGADNIIRPGSADTDAGQPRSTEKRLAPEAEGTGAAKVVEKRATSAVAGQAAVMVEPGPQGGGKTKEVAKGAAKATDGKTNNATSTVTGVTDDIEGKGGEEGVDQNKGKKRPYMGRGKQLGAHLMKSTKEKIWAGEYVEIFKLLHREIRAKEGSKEEERELARRPYVAESMDNWISAFSILASVYCEKYPERAVSLFKYLDIIRGAQTSFGGMAWLRYDEEFRARMAEDEDLAWGQLDEDLWLTVMARPSSSVHTASGHTLSGTPFRGKPTFGVGYKFGRAGATGRGAGAPQGGPCWNYNRGQCSRPNCWFEHKCKACGGGHPVTQCFGAGRGTGESNRRSGRGSFGKGGYAS